MKRDDRDYDLSRMNLKKAAANLNRDYSASFFRWSFVRRFVTLDHDVLEIGCGHNRPLYELLFNGIAQSVNTYLGVDMCELESTNLMRADFKSEFNFVERWKELVTPGISNGFDVIVHLEVIEHMRVKFGEELLRGCHELLRPDGKMIMSAPVFDGKRQSPNHVHEYTIPELQKLLEKIGFVTKRRFGTHMRISHLNKSHDSFAITYMRDELKEYFDNDALSCIFAPLFPDAASGNLWICEK